MTEVIGGGSVTVLEVDDEGSASVALVEGLAQLADDEGVASWQSSGVYLPEVEWPVYVDVAPQESRAGLTFSAYGPDEPDSLQPYDDVRVQIRARGDADPRTARDKLAELYDLLHGLGPVTLPNGTYLQLSRALQTSPTSMGQDASRRWEFVQNYICSIHNETQHRRSA